MQTVNHETISELHDFVVQQAVDDSAMPADDRLHQAEVVADVLNQEELKPKVRKNLLDEYFEKIASRRADKQLVA